MGFPMLPGSRAHPCFRQILQLLLSHPWGSGKTSNEERVLLLRQDRRIFVVGCGMGTLLLLSTCV